MASKRPQDTVDTMANGKRARKHASTCKRPFNPITRFNAEESPLLRLPAELRNRIYEYVFGNHFIHVEYEYAGSSSVYPRMGVSVDEWTAFTGGKAWPETHCFRYYLCKAALSEADAYRRFMDASLEERMGGEAEAFENHWRLGDRFHVDSCQKRHEECCPREEDRVPDWMATPRLQQGLKAKTHVNLYAILTLSLLSTCTQIYTEAKSLPFSQSTFGFRDVTTFLVYFFLLSPSQCHGIESIWLFMRAGLGTHKSLTRAWNSGLFSPGILSCLKRLRVLHVSLSISHTGMGDNGPTRDEIEDPHLNSWVIGLTPLRGLPLEDVTVIVSDDPASKFGAEGYHDRYLQYGWSDDHRNWLLLRERQCFTADEKRQWAERLRNMLLRKSLEI